MKSEWKDSDVVRMEGFRCSQNGRIQMKSEWKASDVVRMEGFR